MQGINLQQALLEPLVGLPLQMLVAYGLMYGVLPALWRPGTPPERFQVRLAAWFLLSLALTFAYRFLVVLPLHANDPNPIADFHLVFASGHVITLFATAAVAGTLRVYRHWWQKELDNLRLLQENHRAELQLLKAQIHPHFLFNTLNSLYALALKQSDQAPVAVNQLTRLLQFVLQQGTAPLVPLHDEVELLRNFIALEQMRYGSRLSVAFEAPTGNTTGHLAPLLLLPLVENAFKHGAAEQLGRAHVRIVLAVAAGELCFYIENSKNSDPPRENATGIGLRNVRQRLALQYPQHRLEISDRNGIFSLRLTLPLAEPEAAILPEPAAGWPVRAASELSPNSLAHEAAA
jgi:LytS/YehU family sensor histidine kinase